MSDSADTDEEVAAFNDRLEEIETSLSAADTEADLDVVEESIDDLEADIENAELPEPPEPDDDEDEEIPDPREELEEELKALRADLDGQRGPYADDVLADIDSEKGTIESTEWAIEGIEELDQVVTTYVQSVSETLDAEIDGPTESTVKEYTASLAATHESIEANELHPDSDTPTINALVEATEEFSTNVDDATAFADLPVREQLNRRGFFDILGHYKDFPVEWSAIKAHEEARNAEMILLAFDLLDSNFMEEHCIDSLRRLADPAAINPMMNLARRRNKDAIEVLGKIGDSSPVDMLLDYADTDSDPELQRVSLKALGEIGDSEATSAVAQQLAAENHSVRSVAARSLGMIGDTRAIEPLNDILADDPIEQVRASAAWALVEIGTESALDAVSQYREDTSYLVEQEAGKAVV